MFLFSFSHSHLRFNFEVSKGVAFPVGALCRCAWPVLGSCLQTGAELWLPFSWLHVLLEDGSAVPCATIPLVIEPLCTSGLCWCQKSERWPGGPPCSSLASAISTAVFPLPPMSCLIGNQHRPRSQQDLWPPWPHLSFVSSVLPTRSLLTWLNSRL